MNPVSDACEHTRGHCSLSRGGALYAGELSDVYGEPLDLRIEGTLPEADATALMRHAAHRGTGRPTNPDPVANAAHRRTGADPKPAPPLSLALAQAHRRSGPPLSLALLSSPHLTLTPTLAQARDHGGRRGDGALLLSRDASRIPSARAPQLEPRLAPIISARTAKPHPHPSSHHGAPSPPLPTTAPAPSHQARARRLNHHPANPARGQLWHSRLATVHDPPRPARTENTRLARTLNLTPTQTTTLAPRQYTLVIQQDEEGDKGSDEGGRERPP